MAKSLATKERNDILYSLLMGELKFVDAVRKLKATGLNQRQANSYASGR